MLLSVFSTPACITMSICAFKGVCVRACVFVSNLNVAPSAPLAAAPATPINEDAFSPRPALGMLFCDCEWPTVDGMSKCFGVSVCACARLTEWVIEMGPQRGQMEIITEGRDGKGGDGQREERGWRKRSGVNSCVKQSGFKSKVYQSVSAWHVECNLPRSERRDKGKGRTEGGQRKRCKKKAGRKACGRVGYKT